MKPGSKTGANYCTRISISPLVEKLLGSDGIKILRICAVMDQIIWSDFLTFITESHEDVEWKIWVKLTIQIWDNFGKTIM